MKDKSQQQIDKVRKLEQNVGDNISESNVKNIDEILALCEICVQHADDATSFAIMKSLERIFVRFQLAVDNKIAVTKYPLIYTSPKKLKEEEHELFGRAPKRLKSDEKGKAGQNDTDDALLKSNVEDSLHVDQNALLQLRFKGKYLSFVHWLLKLLEHQNSQIQVPALQTLMNFVKRESLVICALDAQGVNLSMGSLLYEKVVRHLVHNENQSEDLLNEFKTKYLIYDDVRYYTLKSLSLLISEELTDRGQQQITETFVTQVFEILYEIEMPAKLSSFFVGDGTFEVQEEEGEGEEKKTKKRKKGEEDWVGEMIKNQGKQAKKVKEKKKIFKGRDKVFDMGMHKSAFSKCWLEFLKMPLPIDIYKAVLSRLHQDVIPHMNNPLLLMDFLTDSYNTGGVISVLALHGLFILVTKHNLDYPDFYPKLYALLDESIFHVKYRNRFFKLVELFLSSQYLPQYLMAAFIKKLARLSLTAPPHGCAVIVVLIYNLLQRHPECRTLIHKGLKVREKQVLLLNSNHTEDSAKDLSECDGFDPYIANEPDPAKCHAIDSSLWELQTLTQHYSPAVSKLTKILEGDFEKKFYPLADFVDLSYQSNFESEITRRNKSGTALAYKPKAQLFSQEDGFEEWSFQ